MFTREWIFPEGRRIPPEEGKVSLAWLLVRKTHSHNRTYVLFSFIIITPEMDLSRGDGKYSTFLHESQMNGG